jgi:hypothetical protein
VTRSAQTAAYLDHIQTNIQETVDAATEAQSRREKIGYTIDSYPQKTTSQPN